MFSKSWYCGPNNNRITDSKMIYIPSDATINIIEEAPLERIGV